MKKNIVGILFTTLAILSLNACKSGHDLNEGTPGADWKLYEAPKVTLQIEAEGHEGIAKYLELVEKQGYDGIEDWVQYCCLEIAKELYYTPEEANKHGLKEITYKLNDGGALSYKGGSVPHIEIGFDLNYLVTFINKHGMDVARDEIYGVLCHEITHGLQNEPKNAGGYNGGTECFGFIEGTADLSRLNTGGFNPERFPKQGGTFRDGYNTTAFFYLWIYKNLSNNFLKDINRTAEEYETWTLSAVTEDLYGMSADVLWKLYQNEVAAYPWDNAEELKAWFNPSAFSILQNETVTFSPLIKDGISYNWTFEGGIPATSTEKSPVVTYANSGDYTISLVVEQNGKKDTCSLKQLVKVIDPYATMDITDLAGKVTCQYNDSPSGEGVKNSIDNNPGTKFLTFNSSAWIQFEMEDVYQLEKYTITSANDAPMRDPKDWVLKGSNDGVEFTAIDTRVDENFSDRGQTLEFLLDNSRAYRIYRFDLTHKGVDRFGRAVLQLAEIELIGKKQADNELVAAKL
ncbi:basic secretory protein-like protein [Draconibacterium sp.]|uniref:basic secretory protein-like protein n=1 Tax=Draconibacterium sp. TaxID=1965318 RepID=UPI00356A6453